MRIVCIGDLSSDHFPDLRMLGRIITVEDVKLLGKQVTTLLARVSGTRERCERIIQ